MTRSIEAGRLRERLGTRAAFLRTVVPDLATESVPVEVAADPDQARFEVFDAVGELLTEAAYEAPVCIALEDLHAADEASLLLLEFLARANPTLIFRVSGTQWIEAQAWTDLVEGASGWLRTALGARSSV